jgi:quercetin dioxygenase-like cupin family protein
MSRRFSLFGLLCAVALSFCAVVLMADDASSDRDSMDHHVIVTPDQIKWSAAPAGQPAGAKVGALEGDPGKPGPFVLRVKVPAGYTVPPHWHTNDENITVLSGEMNIGEGDKLDKSAATAVGPGGYVKMPAKMHHFAYSEKETIFQLHGTGPFDINYINPSDDPRSSTNADAGAK